MRKFLYILFLCVFFVFCLPNVSSQEGETFLARELSLIELSPINHFLFMVPPLIWNVSFASKLSMESFGGTVPPLYEGIEWAFRISSMLYPILLPIDPTVKAFVPGLILYSSGLLLYFASWLPYMVDPVPGWARSPIFELAPAYLPLIWLGGISLMSNSWIHAGLSFVFIALHVGEYVIRRKI